jgi:hypothetical protein
MTTVVRRDFQSVPARDAHATWVAIVDLLTQGKDSDRRKELMSVAGVASSLITDQAPRSSPIVVTCEGPRTRIYCQYDDDGLDASDANESKLGFDPLNGEWQVSLPCAEEDLSWVRNALSPLTKRVVARDLDASVDAEKSQGSAVVDVTVNLEGFFKL